MFIPIPGSVFFPSLIPDPTETKKRSNRFQKENYKEFKYFQQNNCYEALTKYGSDSRSIVRKKTYPGSKSRSKKSTKSQISNTDRRIHSTGFNSSLKKNSEWFTIF
jgi:hypothetical protein